MAVQLRLLGEDDLTDVSSIWLQLPDEARHQVSEQLAELLIKSSRSTTTEEITNAALEDPAYASVP